MFHSPEQAIRFAFKIRHKTIVSQAHNVFIGKDKIRSSNRGGSLTAYDFHAQGAMIFGFIERQSELENAWVYWMYGDPREKKIAARMLADRYDGWGRVGLERNDIYRVMLTKSVRKCAEEMGITNYKAWKVRRKILDALTPVERRLLDALWEWIEKSCAE